MPEDPGTRLNDTWVYYLRDGGFILATDTTRIELRYVGEHGIWGAEVVNTGTPTLRFGIKPRVWQRGFLVIENCQEAAARRLVAAIRGD
jgi:hypothetical protein